MDASEYRARRARRGELARRAHLDRDARAELLSAWRFSAEAELIDRLSPRVSLAECREAERLVAWAFGPAPGLVQSTPRSELEFDRQVLGTVPGLVGDEADRTAAAWYLLGRLGEELRGRDEEEQRFVRHAHDDEARKLFTDLFAGRFGVSTGRQLRKLYGNAVKRAFAAVGTDLRLSSSYMDVKIAEALDALEFLAYDGGWVDVAIRMVESAGEPVATLARALDHGAAEIVTDCVAGRESWGATAKFLYGDLPQATAISDLLAMGTDVHVFLRLLEHFHSRVPAGTGVGLPGWLVVTQNRGKIRGRLRQVLAREPRRLAEIVLRKDAFYARSEAAFARFAWDWAWREAHAGFAYSATTLRTAQCERPERQTPPPPAPPLAKDAVLTTVLLLISRDLSDDLRRWANGDPSTSLTDKFYRYLAQAPDAVCDPGARNRSYNRLRNHLEDSLGEYHSEVLRVARRVAEVPVSPRGMKDALARALAPDWNPELIPFPANGCERVRDAFVLFLQRNAASEAPGGES